MSLKKIVFDTTDASTREATHTIGAVLYDKVNDRLGVINTSGQIEAHDADVLAQLQSGVVVSATDLDIRDLSAAQDNVSISDGTDTLGVNADGSINSVVTSTDLDIRDLAAATDSVESWTHDGSGNAISSTTGSLDVNVTNSIDVDDGLANTAILQVKESVGTTSAQIVDGTDELANRKYLMIYNNHNDDIYIGDSTVTKANGYPITSQAEMIARIGSAVDVWAIGEKTGMDIRTLQAS